MKHWIATWFCLCLLLTGCRQSVPELGAKPANLVNEATMADILVEVHLAEARVSKLSMTSTDSATLVFRRLHTSTLRKFSVDTATYAQSYVYYSARPAKLSAIYEKVLVKLKAIEKKAVAKAGNKRPVPAS